VLTSGSERRLVLLRHAKAAWPHGVPDHERPLAGKGRRNAKATGRWFATEGPRPELVVCSDATRARHTWEIIEAALSGPGARVRAEPALYGADPLDLLAVVHGLPDDVSVAVVVGHEPTLGAATLLLAGPGSDLASVARVREKFPTNGVAVLRFTGRWAGLVAGSAVLESFAVPRDGG
jgi:phosphohistidine phosphatase